MLKDLYKETDRSSYNIHGEDSYTKHGFLETLKKPHNERDSLGHEPFDMKAMKNFNAEETDKLLEEMKDENSGIMARCVPQGTISNLST